MSRIGLLPSKSSYSINSANAKTISRDRTSELHVTSNELNFNDNIIPKSNTIHHGLSYKKLEKNGKKGASKH